MSKQLFLEILSDCEGKQFLLEPQRGAVWDVGPSSSLGRGGIHWAKSCTCLLRLELWLQAPAVFCLNLTIPVVNYDKEDHNWNKWLNVLHCITMPVFSVMVTKG